MLMVLRQNKCDKYLYFLLSRKRAEPGIRRVLKPSLNSSDRLTVFKQMAQNTRVEIKRYKLAFTFKAERAVALRTKTESSELLLCDQHKAAQEQDDAESRRQVARLRRNEHVYAQHHMRYWGESPPGGATEQE